MRAYSARSFDQKRRGGPPWKLMVSVLCIGLIGGIVADQIWSSKKSVELIVSTALPPEHAYAPLEVAPEIWSESGAISVRTPQSNAQVASPLVVEGLASMFEQNVVLRLTNARDEELVKTTTTVITPAVGLHGLYRAQLIFEKPDTAHGTLEVFHTSPKDDHKLDRIRVAIQFE